MQQSVFTEIPDRYKVLLKEIKDPVIQKMYNQFSFLYLSIPNSNDTGNITLNNNQNQLENDLFFYLKHFNLIMYEIQEKTNISQQDRNLQNENTIFCVENKCIIVQNIKKQIIISIISHLQEQSIKIINIKSNDSCIYDEIYLINLFIRQIKSNKFVKLTIGPIISYLIQRYNYPSYFFKDPSFFNFGQQNNQIENNVKLSLQKFLYSQNESNAETNFLQLKKSVDQMKNKDQDIMISKKDFKEHEFIFLESLMHNDNYTCYLVMHLESLHIFIMKKIFKNSIYINREIEFCEKYSHRCFCPFCGFLKENDKIVGFIYEYISNGNLHSAIEEEKAIPLMTVIRLFQCIEYLQSKNLIHRDLNPYHIIFNHDNIPYICGLKAIRTIFNFDIPENDIGCDLYISPEQYCGEKVSFPCDIYSYGLIIYFIFEKKNMLQFTSVYLNHEDYLKMENVSQNLENLYEQCVKVSPSERPNIDQIREMISVEINSFDNLIEILINKIDEFQMIQYFYECLLIVINSQENCNKFMENLKSFQPLFLNRNNPSFYLYLGNFYYEKKIVETAKIYYAKMTNSESLVNLGILHENGKGVQKDVAKAIMLYEIAADLGNSDALVRLGNLCLFGLGVIKNEEKAFEYYKLAAELYDDDAFLMLAYMYDNGKGVACDHLKAEIYKNLAAKNK